MKELIKKIAFNMFMMVGILILGGCEEYKVSMVMMMGMLVHNTSAFPVMEMQTE